MILKKFLTARGAWIAAAILLAAYIGVPAGFLGPFVIRRLGAQLGLQVRFDSVWLGLRGVVVSELTCVLPSRGLTLSVDRVILRVRPLRSVMARQIVLGGIHLKSPRLTIQPAGAGDRLDAAAESPAARPPDYLDIDVRDGEIRVLSAGEDSSRERVTTIRGVDGSFYRSPEQPARMHVRFESEDLGSGEFAYAHREQFALRLERISLLRLSEMIDIPHKLYGFLSTDLNTVQGRIEGDIKIEHLIWQAVSPHDESELTTFVSGLDASARFRGSLDWPESVTPALGAAERLTRPEPDESALGAASDEPAGPALKIEKMDVAADGLNAVVRGTIQLPERAAELDIECPDFRESQLESLSSHFWVLRHLNKFLARVDSPAPIQGRISVSGPLHKPVNWKYKGLIDVRRDTFSYKGFAGDYPFSGTVQFDTSGVFVPEVLIDLGGAPMKVYGTAADYLTHQTDIRFTGDNLDLTRFLANHLRGLHLDGEPQGEGTVRLALQRAEEEWSLTGQVNLRRVKVPVSGYRVPLLAFGDIRFSGGRGDGSLRVRIDKLESSVSPFFENLFTPEQESGFQFKAQNMDLRPLGRAMSRPIAYVPSDGVADVDVRVFHRAGADRWEMSGRIDLAGGTLAIPVFSVPAKNVSGRLVLLGDAMRLSDVTGQLPGAAVRAQGASLPADPRRWSLQFHTPALNLNEMLAAIRRADPASADATATRTASADATAAKAGPRVSYEVLANIYADELDFHAFGIPGVSAQLRLEPNTVEIMSQTPFRSEYRSLFSDTAVSSSYSAALDHYPLRDLFKSPASLSGDVSGSLALRSPRFADTDSVSGEMDLAFENLTFRGAPPFLQIINLLHLSLTPSIVLEPFPFRAPVRNGLIPVQVSNRTNTGDLTLRGRLGLDAAFYPLDDRDSGFHARLIPQGNLLTSLLHEIKIFSLLLTGQRQGVVLDFDLFGHYSKPHIIWREDPVGSIIKGWSRELLPGILQFGPLEQPEVGRGPRADADTIESQQRRMPDEDTESPKPADVPDARPSGDGVAPPVSDEPDATDTP